MWNGVWSIMYPAEFMCLSAAKLLVLDRLLCFVEFTLHCAIHARMRAASYVVVGISVLGNIIGFLSNCVSACATRSLSYRFHLVQSCDPFCTDTIASRPLASTRTPPTHLPPATASATRVISQYL